MTRLSAISMARHVLDAPIVRDIRYALRTLAASPGYTTVAVLTLAVGIGATTALFTISRDVLLRSLPVGDPHSLAELGCVGPMEDGRATDGCDTSYPGFALYRAHREAIAGAFAFASIPELSAPAGPGADIVRGMLASGDMADVLGLRAEVGRMLSPADDRVDAPLAVLLGYAYWQRRFGGDPAAIGEALRLNDQAATIVGVAPPAFRGLVLGDVPDVILPLASADRFLGRGTLANGGSWWLRVIVRRRPDVALERLRQMLAPTFAAVVEHHLQSVPPELADRVADTMRALRFRVEPAGTGALSEFRYDLDRPLRTLAIVVVLFLLVACANLAGVVGARALARQPELTLRLALGATRGRLMRQAVTETLLVATAGGALGVVAAIWLAPGAVSFAAGEAAERALDLRPDLTVLAVAAGITVLAGILAAAGAVVRASRTDAQSVLKKARNAGEGPRMAQVTLTAQCALTVILLATAGLFVNSLAHLNAVDPGFVAEGRVLAEVAPGLAGYDQAAAAAYVRRAVDALERVPGVRSVSYSSAAMGRLGNTTVVDVVGFEGAAASRRVSGRVEVGARFAETVGLRLLYGRDVAVLDSANAAPVALVNESFARNFFGRANAVGRQFTLLGQRARHTIVGIVADARDRGVRSGPERVVYEAPFDHPEEGVTLTVRGDADTAAWLPAVERSLRDADRAVPIRRLRTAASDLDDALGRERLLGVLTSAFGGVAMFLVGLGLYGTVSGAVARRTSEIGIRMALGSTIGRVIWLVTRDACIAVIAGGAAGLLVSLLLTRLIQAQLFGVTATDPFVAAGVIALLAGTAVAAAAWPARRAARIDPAAALRAE